MSARDNATIGSTSEPTDMSRALARFLRSYPAFAKTGALDVLRATDYARLDKQGHVYLDYTGGGLYAESQLRQYQKLLIGDVLGHPRLAKPGVEGDEPANRGHEGSASWSSSTPRRRSTR